MKDSLRVVMAINQANPELLAELANIPERLRAERLRVLATIGLKILSQGSMAFAPWPGPPAQAGVAPVEPEPPKVSGKSAAMNFAKKLKGLGN